MGSNSLTVLKCSWNCFIVFVLHVRCIICVCASDIRANRGTDSMLMIWSDSGLCPFHYVPVITPIHLVLNITLLLFLLTPAAVCGDV